MLSTRFFSRNTLVVLSAAFATFSSSTAAALIDNGTTLTSNGIPYYSHGLPVATLNIESSNLLESAASHGSDLFPMTIIHTDVQSFGLPELNSTFSRFSAADDVFQKSFLHSVFLSYNGTGAFEPNVASCLSEAGPFGTKLFLSELSGSGNSTKASLSQLLPNGPYFVSARTGQVFQAYRLYPDDNLAFTQPSVSDHNGGHLPLTAVTENLMTRSVAVPSRLYYTATKEQPLAGLRLAVKDIFHIKGLKTSGGNRAYYYLYPERNATGPAVQRLLDQGAVLVGKTGTVQFANGDRVTADWVDVHCPFNPRGDGYQDPSGSSSGSGAAIGAYEWLDLAVGSDTGGSMRGPAGRQGIYGNRPSTGAVSLNNVIPLSPHLDTAGVFARSASLWSEATHAWYANYTDDHPSYPKNVYYSTEGADPEDPAAKLVESFVSKLSGFLDTNYTISNISEQWAASHPTNVTSSINELLNETYAILTSNDQFNLLGRPFFSDYAAQHDGRRPFVRPAPYFRFPYTSPCISKSSWTSVSVLGHINPGPLVRWQWGQNHSASYDSAVHNMTTFRTWWTSPPQGGSGGGFGAHNPQTCSQGIFVYPSYLGTPSYRNTYFDAPTTPPLGWSTGRAAVFGGGAELVVPVGEVAYESTISLQTEYLPVGVNLLVAPGCDLVLANLVKELEAEGILKASRAGSRI